MAGEASDYYNGAGQQNGERNYPMQQQPYNGQQQNGQYGGPQYMPPPPTYQQDFGKWNQDSKPTFDQAFKIQKPKWNDWWFAFY